MILAYEKKYVNYWFGLFCALHLFAWTFVPTWVRNNLPLDTIESTIWGNQLEWGYDKNPFLNGWLTALLIHLGGRSEWIFYFASQLSVIICFIATFLLAKRMLTPLYALIAVLLLESIQYYNLHAIEFNDNTLELGLWAITIYCFYRSCCPRSLPPHANAVLPSPARGEGSTALDDGLTRNVWWVLTALFAGVSMMDKYYILVLLASMFLFLLANKERRQQFKTISPYLGIGVFSLVVLPHVIWLFQHHFITVTYMFERGTHHTSRLSDHFIFPTKFAFEQALAIMPALLFSVILMLPKMQRLQRQSIGSFDADFLFYIGMGPFLLTILFSFCFNTYLRAGWGMPLFSLWGMILIALIKPILTKTIFNRFILFITMFMVTMLIGYSLSLIHSDTPSSANFPGREIANAITDSWHKRYHRKLNYVAGSRWISGNIAFYSADHPVVFMEWNTQRAPWINLPILKEQGGVFIWDLNKHETLPEGIQKQFPSLSKPTLYAFDWYRNQAHLPPIRIGVAFLAPMKHGQH